MTHAGNAITVTPALTGTPDASAGASPPRGGNLVGGTILAAAAPAAWMFNLLILGYVGPRHAEIYRDFGVAVSGATRWLLDLAHILDVRTQPVSLLILAALPLVLGTSLVIAARSRSAGMRTTSIVFSIVLLLLAVLAFVVAAAVLGSTMAGVVNQINATP